ncbi:MAG: DUF1844 domain-containing protein [Candidatus Hydrogenedentes bacterium]|nr:DUF1844 domain-containing protein [Candidatus Hydrogenedentota bacterium]
MPEESPKIIVDESWKARVQREREETKAPADAPTPGDEPPGAPEGPSFDALVSGLAMQAMLALGFIAPRDAEQVVIDLNEAKYTIDLMLVLRDKTKGNLTPQESGRLTTTIAELQQGYVARVQQVQESAMQRAGVDPHELRRP